ncbi:MAG: M13-type metalloendopeptidase [Rhizomicrobium sp.]|jgi:putative endopeptidase
MKRGLIAAAVAASLTTLVLAADKPQFGAWGFDSAGADFKAKPGDDFFRYANGAWLDRTPIPSDKPGISLRILMTDTVESRIHDLMEKAASGVGHEPSDLTGKVGAFYKAFMDEKRIDALGAKPIAAQFAAVRAAKTRSDFAALMGRSTIDFEPSLFNVNTDIDLKDPNHYAVYLGQGGLGLPDRDYYLQPNFAAQKAAYQAYAAHLLALIGWINADANAKALVDFETKIAQASWTKAQDRDINATYNPLSIADLQALTPGFDWKAWLASAGLGDRVRVIVAEKSAFPKIAAVYAAAPLDTLRAWLAFHIADGAALYLSKDFSDAFFELHQKTLAGQQQEQARWKRAVHLIGGNECDQVPTECFGSLAWGVGQLYTARYFPPEAKAKIEDLVDHLKAAYRTRLENNDWMSPATKTEAIRKLETYNIKVGYPDHPRDYSSVVIRDDDLVGDVLRSAAADWAFYVGRLNGHVDRTDWSMTPQTNDAYNGSLRDIVFPAGILQAPMFDPDADPAVNYGAIGGVIGHEMTHGFDDQGRKIDADGALRDWWTADDARKFEARAAMLGAQYSSFEPLPGVHVQGALTMGENIADLGGLTLALEAYHESLQGKPAPVIDGLTGDQRVFLGWAQAWRGKVTDSYVKKQVVSDPHSPRQFRVNGVVRNLDAWYAAFDVKPGDKLYVAPDQRVRIW